MTSPTQSAMEQQQREAAQMLPELPQAVAHVHSSGEVCMERFVESNGVWPVELVTLRQAHDYARAYADASQASELRSLRDSLALAKADLERYRWLRDNFLGADFDYGGNDAEMRNGEQVLLIRHAGTPVWGSLDLTVDAALNKEQP